MNLMSTFGINWRRAGHEASQADGETKHADEEETSRRSYSIRALLPGPYVRYPKE